MTHVKNIGEKVRKIREFKNLSLEELADRSKLSVELIVQIEENMDLPFLAPLIRIARSLDVRLGTFLDDAIELGPVIARKGAGKVGISQANHNTTDSFDLNFIPLATDKSGRHMEPFLIDVSPSLNKERPLNSHVGEEFVYVLSGEIEISYGSDTYKISAGDSIYFDSSVIHNVHTSDDNPARILAVVYAPY
jgi:transcriptional regulator with XRE-family HTH domain